MWVEAENVVHHKCGLYVFSHCALRIKVPGLRLLWFFYSDQPSTCRTGRSRLWWLSFGSDDALRQARNSFRSSKIFIQWSSLFHRLKSAGSCTGQNEKVSSINRLLFCLEGHLILTVHSGIYAHWWKNQSCTFINFSIHYRWWKCGLCQRVNMYS